jgi:hypothetical protein
MEGRITTPPTMLGVQKRARQGKAEGILKETKRNHKPLKRVEYNAYQAKQLKSIPSMLMGETQPLSTDARESECEQARKNDEGQLHPSPLLGLVPMPAHPLVPMPARVEVEAFGGGGSFGNGLLHSRPLPRRRMNQRPS